MPSPPPARTPAVAAPNSGRCRVVSTMLAALATAALVLVTVSRSSAEPLASRWASLPTAPVVTGAWRWTPAPPSTPTTPPSSTTSLPEAEVPSPPSTTAPITEPIALPTTTTQPPVETSAANGPRVAFCLSGGIRTLRLVLPTIAEKFIDSLQPDPSLRHVFLEVTTKHDCEANYNNAAIIPECKQQFAETVAWLENRAAIQVALGRGVTVNIENEFNCNHPFMAEHQCCVRDKRTMNDNGEGYFWGMAQYMRRRLCYDRIKQYEAQHNMTFDLVATTRPDMHYLEAVPPADFFLRSEPRVFAMSKDDGWGDYIFISPRSLTEALHQSFSAIFAEPCKQAHFNRGATPESQLGPLLERSVPHQRWPFQIIILRSMVRADCWRMANGINDAGRYLSREGGLKPIHEVCRETFPHRTH